MAVVFSLANGISTYKLILYTTTKQTVGSVRLAVEFRVSVQKNNYVSFYDEQKQLWSILFDSEELVASFATQVNYGFLFFFCFVSGISDLWEFYIITGGSVQM